MITLNRFEKAFVQLDYDFLASYYLENKEFLVELFNYALMTGNVKLTLKLKNYLDEEQGSLQV